MCEAAGSGFDLSHVDSEVLLHVVSPNVRISDAEDGVKLLLQIAQCPRRHETLTSHSIHSVPGFQFQYSLPHPSISSKLVQILSFPYLSSTNPQLSGRPAHHVKKNNLLLHVAFTLHNILVMAARLPFLKIFSTSASPFQSGTQTQPQPSYLYPISRSYQGLLLHVAGSTMRIPM
jgi:hypothetical protein